MSDEEVNNKATRSQNRRSSLRPSLPTVPSGIAMDNLAFNGDEVAFHLLQLRLKAQMLPPCRGFTRLINEDRPLVNRRYYQSLPELF